MDRNDRNILILGILILVLLAVGYYFLLLSPLRASYAEAYEERTRKETQERQLEQTASQLENIRRDAPDIERQILEYSKRLPNEAEIPTLMIQIEEVAEEAGVTQLSIEPGNPEAPPGGGDFSRIPLTMSFEGTYVQMQDFVLRVRNLARLVTINEVTYCRFPQREGADCPIEQPVVEQTGEETARIGIGSGDDLLTVQVSAETYVQPAAGAEDTSGGGATNPTPSPPPAGNDKAGGNKAADGDKAGGNKAEDGGKSK